jgi:hypothetical protein
MLPRCLHNPHTYLAIKIEYQLLKLQEIATEGKEHRRLHLKEKSISFNIVPLNNFGKQTWKPAILILRKT